MICVTPGMLAFFAKPVMNTASTGMKDTTIPMNIRANDVQKLGIQFSFFV